VPNHGRGTFALDKLTTTHKLIFAVVLYGLYTIAIFKYLTPLLYKNYVHVVAFKPILGETFFGHMIVYLFYNTP